MGEFKVGLLHSKGYMMLLVVQAGVWGRRLFEVWPIVTTV
jgi:hypothetical protein